MATLPRSADRAVSPAFTRSSILLSITASMRLTKKLATLAIPATLSPRAARSSSPAMNASATAS